MRLLFNGLVRKPQSKLEQKTSAQSSAIKQHHNSRFCYNCRSAWQMCLTCLPIAWFIIISWTPKNSVLSSKAKWCTTTKQHVILISDILCPNDKGCNLWLQAAELVLKWFQPQTPAIMFKNWLQIHRALPMTRPHTQIQIKAPGPEKKDLRAIWTWSTMSSLLKISKRQDFIKDSPGLYYYLKHPLHPQKNIFFWFKLQLHVTWYILWQGIWTATKGRWMSELYSDAKFARRAL